MASRDPHAVLGVEPGASQVAIKAAWRRLARQHHPDLEPDEAARRRADRRMAEINAAYQALRDRARRRPAASRERASGEAGSERRPRASGPPPPPPTRPVTARVDTSATFRPRNATIGRAAPPSGQPPFRPGRPVSEPLRASDPSGPLERARLRRHRRPKDPTLAEARDRVIDFGKFHGHTLGEIADFEPSYIDWVARTITRDRDLVAAARVIQSDLDRRAVVRRIRDARPGTPR